MTIKDKIVVITGASQGFGGALEVGVDDLIR